MIEIVVGKTRWADFIDDPANQDLYSRAVQPVAVLMREARLEGPKHAPYEVQPLLIVGRLYDVSYQHPEWSVMISNLHYTLSTGDRLRIYREHETVELDLHFLEVEGLASTRAVTDRDVMDAIASAAKEFRADDH